MNISDGISQSDLLDKWRHDNVLCSNTHTHVKREGEGQKDTSLQWHNSNRQPSVVLLPRKWLAQFNDNRHARMSRRLSPPFCLNLAGDISQVHLSSPTLVVVLSQFCTVTSATWGAVG